MSARPGVAQIRHRPQTVVADPFWREQANCREDVDPDMFTDPDRYHLAKKVCVGCPVLAECESERRGAAGVWGGRVYGLKKNRLSSDEYFRVPHGTEAARKRHQRAKEPLCNICRGDK